MGEAVPLHRDELLLEFPSAGIEDVDVRFPPAMDFSAEDLFNSPWRAHLIFRLPVGVAPQPRLEELIVAGLKQRNPLSWYSDGVLFVNFSVEDGARWSQKLALDVSRFVKNLVAGARLVHAEIDCRQPDIRDLSAVPDLGPPLSDA